MPVPPTKISLKPKRHHGYSVVLFILGTLFPPLAVAARFGVGGDFWLNLLLTICGYFPGHGHNFYIQNIRNNKNRARTPKWAARYGLIDTTAMDRKKKRSDWAKRYGERLPQSALDHQAYEEGQQMDTSRDSSYPSNDAGPGPGQTEYWREDEERYYGQSRSSQPGYGESTSSLHSENSGGRWTYPANFNEAVIEGGSRRRSKAAKKDRWARTEEAYDAPNGSVRRKKKKKRRPSEEADSLPPLDSDLHVGHGSVVDVPPIGGEQRDPLEHEF